MSTADSGAPDCSVRESKSGHRLKVVHVVSGLEIAHGGPSYSVPRLNDAIIAAGLEGRIYADLTPGELANNEAATVVTFDRRFGTTPFLRKLHISRDMQHRLLGSRGDVDIIHSHGLWRMPNIYAARAARRHGVPHVISPRGMLSRVALDFSRASKALFWYAWQKAAVDECACVHVTSSAEYQEVRERGIDGPVAIIPNGVDLPALPAVNPARPVAGARRVRTLLYLGRIHRKKAIDQLIAAWAALAADFPDWRLRIVGPSEEGYGPELARLAARLPRVSIEEAIYGKEKWQTFAEADLFILPSRNENFGIAVVESLACGRPVITTKGTPWKDVETQRCGWWIDNGIASIEAALRAALSMPVEELDEMGARGLAWVKQAFAWDAIGEEMARVYLWLCFGAARPASVVLD